MIQESFWSNDYLTGVNNLIDALRICVAENKQFLTMVREHIKIENSTAAGLAKLSQEPVVNTIPINSGSYISKTSSLQSALSIFTTELVNQVVVHTRVASDLDTKVRLPLQNFCEMYAKQVDTCSSRLLKIVSEYRTLYVNVTKQRAVYFDQCHKYEDATKGGSPRDPIIKTIRLLRDSLKVTAESPNPDTNQKDSNFSIAGLTYTRQSLAELMKLILRDMSFTEYKVPLLGSYENVITGSMLATATRKHLKNDSFAYAEKFGQCLVDHGFVNPLGQISNRFQTSHTTYYQVQPALFELVSEVSEGSDFDSLDSGSLSASRSSGSIENQGNLTVTDSSEEYYLQAILELDSYRCNMEIEIMKIYEFLNQLEQDRESVIKKAMQIYVVTLFKTEELQQMRSRLSLAEQKIDPKSDLLELIAKHRTGPYLPNVTVFERYFGNDVVQTFGVDLSRSRFFIDIVLNWLQSLNTKETSQISLWTKPEPIVEIYKLRAQINTGKAFSPESVFRFFSLSTVISTFRQYLLELPDSIVSFMVYERIKELYAETRDLPQSNDVILTLIQIPQDSRSALKQIIMYLRAQFDPTAYEDLAQSLAFPLVRPCAPSAVNMDDTHPKQFLYDLLCRGPEFFDKLVTKQTELKSLNNTPSPKIHRNYYVSDSPSPTPASRRAVSSGNIGMRPLSLHLNHQIKFASFFQGNSDTSANRGLNIKPLLPISSRSKKVVTGSSAHGITSNVEHSPGVRCASFGYNSASNISVGSTSNSPTSSPSTSISSCIYKSGSLKDSKLESC